MKMPFHITRAMRLGLKLSPKFTPFGRKLRIARRRYMQLGDLGGLKYEKTNN